MKVFTDPIEFRAHNEKLRESGRSIGMFGTLGAVHRGHLSLVDRARAENDVVVSSIFVNPLMFNESAEADRYPSDDEGDLAKLEAAGVDAVVVPPREAVYPPGHVTRITLPELEGRYEAARLPNMLTGISTICTKLLHICVPHRWYFGEKDAQQVAVMKRLARDLWWSCEVVPCPSVREADGLPVSSRNALMDEAERAAALCVVDAVRLAKLRYDAGERDVRALTAVARARIAEQPGARLDYATVVDKDSFDDRETADSGSLVVVAADLGRVRVLDNHPLGRELPPELVARG
ncbi:pantoate--beta-alanine ligase [Kutzneria viridogrisea]|uniref:Pantothenate synthetase n=2 Tax=Kutzneria TaxID=43356 RepID=W5W7Z2_9PSEU|nr:pantoate--beta-alanine ligase [Kutzneria albida]AHH97258.1 Pantothenate synthetase [Kutzneria albida DSM 43870]MBA8930828.1 pantoate--beta-alanine ligase [Kutzneria viridogrisea]